MRRYTTLKHVTCTVINYKSQGSVTTWFRSGGIFY